MDRDGRDFDDDADWLLAQLAAGSAPARQGPPVAPPSPVAPPEQAVPAPAPKEPPAPAPRREEVLDWFSLAESPAAPDAPTRALPVIGGPPAPSAPEGVPSQVEPPVSTPAAEAEPAAGLPAWNPPFTVGRPGAVPPAPPASTPLTPVQPTLGEAPVASEPPPAPVAPSEPATPPGPVTPTAPFALTWGPGGLDSEDAIRAAFRNLSAPVSPEPKADAGAPSPMPSELSSREPEPSGREPEPSGREPEPTPFADFTPPPVARQSFTPVATAAATPEPVTPPASPTPSTAPTSAAPGSASPEAVQPPAEPVRPPRHPIAPTTAPAGWDERATRPGRAAGLDDELWSAVSDEGSSASATPAGVVPSDPLPAPASERFGAFAADTVDPFAALTRASAPTAPPATPAESTMTMNDFPFIEVRGEAESSVSEPVGVQTESAANRRVPFPAFAAAGGGGDDRGGDRESDEPVDDLLAALAAGGGRPASDEGSTDVPAERSGPGFGSDGGGTPPIRPGDEALDALGLAFDDHDDDDDDEEPDEPEPSRNGAARFFGRGRADATADPEPAPDAESPIARELAETGYFWNLTPDPSAADPKAAAAGGADDDLPSPIADGSRDETAFDEPGADEPAAGSPVADEPAALAVEPTEVAAEPEDEGPEEPLPFWMVPIQAEPEPEPEPELEPAPAPEPAPEPSSSFDDDLAATDAAEPATTAYPTAQSTPPPGGDDALTALFPTSAAASRPAPAAPADHDDDPLAALFGSARLPAEPDSGPSGWPFAADTAVAGAGLAGTSGARAATPPPAPAPAQPRPSGAAPRPPGSGGPAGPGGSGPGGDHRTVRTLLWIAGGLVVLVVLAGLFYVGTLISGGGEAAGPSATPTPTETPVAAPTAPQPVGVHAWNTLFGGECIDPFGSAWDEEFTIVDCAAPHAAQLVYRGTLPGDATTPFPGESEIASQMNLLCTAPGVIDVAAVSGVNDLQVQAAFPVTEEQWAAGERTYYCFANRAGGEPLTGSIAGPGPAA